MTDSEYDEVRREARDYIRRTSFAAIDAGTRESEHDVHTHTQHAEYGAAAH
jgi:hypothetical protein